MAFPSSSWLLTWSTAAGLLLVTAPGCGARSTLEADTGSGGAGAQAGAGPAGGGGGGGAGAGAGPQVLPQCSYVSAGDPIVAVEFPDRHAVSPSLIATDPNPASGSPKIAIQYIASGGSSPLHPENPVTRMEIHSQWPSYSFYPPLVVGVESHSYGVFARSNDGSDMALSWYTDLGGLGRVAFRTLGIDDLALGPVVDIDPQGQTGVALAAGAGIGDDGVGHAGNGYALAWRRGLEPGGLRTTAVAILDDQGNIGSGPHNVTPLMENPPGSHIVWTGSHYLIASTYNQNCPPNEPLCMPNSVVVTRFRPNSGMSETDDSGIEVASTYGTSPDSVLPRARLAHHGGRTWLAWSLQQPPSIGGWLFMAELSDTGELIDNAPVIIETDAGISSLHLSASDQGLAVAWIEPGDDDGPPDQPGASVLRGYAYDHDRNPLGEIPALPITKHQGPAPSVATIGGTPRALLITWSGAQIGGGLDVTYLARFNCVEVP